MKNHSLGNVWIFLFTFKFSFSCLQKARANSLCLLYEPCFCKWASFLPADWHEPSLFKLWLLLLLLLLICTFFIDTLQLERLFWPPSKTFLECEGKAISELLLLSNTEELWEGGHRKIGFKSFRVWACVLLVSWDEHCGAGWAFPFSLPLWRAGPPSGIMSFTRTKEKDYFKNNELFFILLYSSMMH